MGSSVPSADIIHGLNSVVGHYKYSYRSNGHISVHK